MMTVAGASAAALIVVAPVVSVTDGLAIIAVNRATIAVKPTAHPLGVDRVPAGGVPADEVISISHVNADSCLGGLRHGEEAGHGDDCC